jgi:hypothetical protein
MAVVKLLELTVIELATLLMKVCMTLAVTLKVTPLLTTGN